MVPTTSKQAVRIVRESFEAGPRLGRHALDTAIDLITSRATDVQVMEVFACIPADVELEFPRMMLLRRLWQRGPRFLREYRPEFQNLPLTQSEHHKMVLEFGEAAVIEFFRPFALVGANATETNEVLH